ncbi:MAG: HD domain-containing protein [Candidatus Methanofastidiosia archaeon]
MEKLDSVIEKMLDGKPLEFYRDITKYSPYLDSGNRMIMGRLGYNDHGVIHAKIVTRNSLIILDLLKDNVTPTIVKEKIGTIDDTRIVIIGASYLHDIGGMIHRDWHNMHSVILARPILLDILPKYVTNPIQIMSEILHAIYSHHENVQCLTTEAGIVSIADGTDMEEGRGRVPYRRGRIDIHSASALAIDKVRLLKGDRPLRIEVSLHDNAGIFQVQEILGKKLETTGLENYVEIYFEKNGKKFKMDL